MSIDFVSMTQEMRTSWLETLGQPKFRLKQIEEWVFTHGVVNYADMANLPKSLREDLESSGVPVTFSRVVAEHHDATTTKLAILLGDGQAIEAVVMQYHHGISLCVSSQVGCKMACSFCATGTSGFRRNLTRHEMVSQLLLANNLLRAKNVKITHIVMMGMGEPLDNYDETIGFIRLTCSPLFGISPRRITVSTCGLVPQMERLAHEDLPINLSVSLHAPNDELRSTLMPTGKTYALNKILATMHYYAESTGRRVTIEYTLIKGVNDREKDADELVSKIKGSKFHVNLIPLNPFLGSALERPSPARTRKFQQILTAAGLTATIRRELGSEIGAACGQLGGNIRQ
ncbi:MAG: putative dual-specificity RNA methyltransferase RlmN [Firmicutes bacterium]|nr:putative dual-specificity RNA methyltransferase RlmN [Bacillota bacterium]